MTDTLHMRRYRPPPLFHLFLNVLRILHFLHLLLLPLSAHQVGDEDDDPDMQWLMIYLLNSTRLGLSLAHVDFAWFKPTNVCRKSYEHLIYDVLAKLATVQLGTGNDSVQRATVPPPGRALMDLSSLWVMHYVLHYRHTYIQIYLYIHIFFLNIRLTMITQNHS